MSDKAMSIKESEMMQVLNAYLKQEGVGNTSKLLNKMFKKVVDEGGEDIRLEKATKELEKRKAAAIKEVAQMKKDAIKEVEQMKKQAEKDIQAKTKAALKIVADEEKASKKRLSGGETKKKLTGAKKKSSAMDRLLAKC